MSNYQLMQRVYVSVPDVAFHKIVNNWAFYIGKLVLTQRDYKTALINYSHMASKLN